MREFPPPDELLLPYDAAPLLWVKATRWQCVRCDPDERAGANTTVAWIGTLGRCHVCGQKMCLASPLDTHIPSVDEQTRAGL